MYIFNYLHMKTVQLFLFVSLFMVAQLTHAQTATTWKGKQCAVVLTYDDALNVHLDNAIPALDSAGFKGTFYLIGKSEVLSKRLPEWRLAAQHGHELGNHSLNHPCDATLDGRSWVAPGDDLSKYTIERAVTEIKATNTLLQAIDGKTNRTFAYPCGDLNINGVNFYTQLESTFVGARGVQASLQKIDKVNLNNIDCYMINGHSGTYMIDLVKKAMETNTLLIFLFHGVGGEHNINVSLSAHSQLIHFLKQHEQNIWVAPLVDVAAYVKEQQAKTK